MSTQILIYDDNVALRESIETLLAEYPTYTVAAMLGNPETVETDIRQLKPDVVLMDIDMPVVTGIDAVKRIHKVYPTLPIIMLTVFDDSENIFHAICAGASGYILKRHVSEEIIPAIRNVLEGGAPMTGSVAKKVLQMLPVSKLNQGEQAALTSKETEILRLLTEGFSYKMIAEQVNIGLDGVRFHIKKIYDKLHVHSATEAVSVALKDRLI